MKALICVRSGSPVPLGWPGVGGRLGLGDSLVSMKRDGRAFENKSVILCLRLGACWGYGGGRSTGVPEDVGRVGATITRYAVDVSSTERPVGMKVCGVKGCRSRMCTGNACCPILTVFLRVGSPG